MESTHPSFCTTLRKYQILINTFMLISTKNIDTNFVTQRSCCSSLFSFTLKPYHQLHGWKLYEEVLNNAPMLQCSRGMVAIATLKQASTVNRWRGSGPLKNNYCSAYKLSAPWSSFHLSHSCIFSFPLKNTKFCTINWGKPFYEQCNVRACEVMFDLEGMDRYINFRR